MKTERFRGPAARVALVLLPLSLLAACGGGADGPDPAASADTVVDEILEGAGVEAASGAEPCAILDDALVARHFEVPEGAEITRRPSEYSPHPLCIATWPKPNAAEIEAKTGEAMMEYMQKKMKGEDVEMPDFRTDVEVSLTLLDPAASAEAAAAQFDAAMTTLSQGITASHEDVEVTFQADVEPVGGLGDRAMWAPKLRQVSVLSGSRVFHVAVRVAEDPAGDRDLAIGVARSVAERL